MRNRLQAVRSEWIETFRRRSCLDLMPRWQCLGAPGAGLAIDDPWGETHRPDWVERGLLCWARGGVWKRLQLRLHCPTLWRTPMQGHARLVLSWWADQARLWVDGTLVHEGDLFDTRCRWRLPATWALGQDLDLVLELRSPLHDDGALITSQVIREPRSAAEDQDQHLLPQALTLALPDPEALPEAWLDLDPASPEAAAAVRGFLDHHAPASGTVHWIGHAHLDLAWLWPVAETWDAAERTFRSALDLMERFPLLHFAHSTPALYQWMERFRPALWARLQAASSEGRWEPLNGPWVETDCVLVGTASLWQQFTLGQRYSRSAFPQWSHHLAWLPDSFGFGAGLPAVAAREGVQWFCTHKLAWNASVPFRHRVFRWRSRGGDELMALMLPPIGTDADPGAIQLEHDAFQQATGIDHALWTPGVGDHGGGPTAESMEQMTLWDGHPQVTPRRPSTVRAFLDQLEPTVQAWPVWRDELYLDLHRGCATSRPDQKRHNRTLERLLRDADLLAALGSLRGTDGLPQRGRADWRNLLFQQFHDILPGTSIPEVFAQAEPLWRRSRRQAKALRDQGLSQLIGSPATAADWAWVGLQPLARWSPVLRLPRGGWSSQGQALPVQPAGSGGCWVQLPLASGVAALPLRRHEPVSGDQRKPRAAVRLERLENGMVRLSNDHLCVDCGPLGLHQLWDRTGQPQLRRPLALCRYRDQGEFWDAWDLAQDYRRHALPVAWEADSLEVVEAGPLVARVSLRARVGDSQLRLDCQLRADHPWLEIICSVSWRQVHELLRLEIPLAEPVVRWAADTSGGVLERPAVACTAGEQMRWEVPVISWCATERPAPGGGVALLLDGPQGVDCTADHLGVSLLRGPTWPDPSADEGWHRQRLALMPATAGWCSDGVAQAAIAFREPGWWGPASLAEPEQCFPPLPLGVIPVAIQPRPEGDSDVLDSPEVRLRVLNPGARRQIWKPAGWLVGRHGQKLREAITLMPGELVELRLSPRG